MKNFNYRKLYENIYFSIYAWEPFQNKFRQIDILHFFGIFSLTKKKKCKTSNQNLMLMEGFPKTKSSTSSSAQPSSFIRPILTSQRGYQQKKKNNQPHTNKHWNCQMQLFLMPFCFEKYISYCFWLNTKNIPPKTATKPSSNRYDTMCKNKDSLNTSPPNLLLQRHGGLSSWPCKLLHISKRIISQE